MQGFCLCCLSLAVEGIKGLFGGADLLASAPFLPGGGSTAPCSDMGGCFV